jgi:very-short-patch-repair endonuclease
VASKLESRFLFLWRCLDGPPLEREYRFYPDRKWRADFAHPPSRTLIEVEGGIFMRAGGRHSRGSGYAKDAEKYLEATLSGWRVVRLTERQLDAEWIERIIALVAQYSSGSSTVVADRSHSVMM